MTSTHQNATFSTETTQFNIYNDEDDVYFESDVDIIDNKIRTTDDEDVKRYYFSKTRFKMEVVDGMCYYKEDI